MGKSSRARRSLFFFGLVFVFSPLLSTAEDALSVRPGGVPVFPRGLESSLSLAAPAAFGTSRMVAAEGEPFTRAIEIHTNREAPNPWDFQLTAKIPTTVRKGDVLWVTFWMRTTETSNETHEGSAEISVEQSSSPYAQLDFAFSAGKTWKQYACPSVAECDFTPDQGKVCLRVGYAPQIIQIGGLQMLDYGPSIKPSDLPQTRITYPGMEADAPWRKAAAERIDRYRKADLRVIVRDASGHPLPGATVRIDEQRAAFGFGSCVTAKLIEGTGPDSDRYREIIKNDYSKVVMENDLKWGPWEKSAATGHRTTLAALHWLGDQGIDIRGHNLVWPSWRKSPSRLEAYKNDPAALERQIENHIRDIVGTTKGLLTEWDVVNEPFANHDILDLLPPDAMTTWFKLVHRIDPRPVLYLNDYAGLIDRGEDTPHKDAFEKTLRMLKAQGAPIGGLGIQAHFGQDLTGPEELVKELDRWAKLGLNIEITEFDINMDDEKVQGQYTRDFMTAVFSHPAVSAILMWGFWEGADWKPKGALYRKDWSIKPNGQAWNDLVLKEWQTHLTARADTSGAVSTRAFLGDYRITVTYHGKSKTWPATLSPSGAVLSAVLPNS